MEVCGLSGTDSPSEHVKLLSLLLTKNLYEQPLKFCKLLSQFHIGNYIQRYILGQEEVGREKKAEISLLDTKG